MNLLAIEENMKELAPYRKAALFNEFLVKGYTAIALSSVPEKKADQLLQAKVCLGTLITLCDDFADRPATRNPDLLERLYRLNFKDHSGGRLFNDYNSKVIGFAELLFKQMHEILKPQPYYNEFIDILNFDLSQFYMANQYSALVTTKPYLNNLHENRMYTHHNMGMVCAAMIDLMSLDHVQLSDLAAMRQVFLLAQRMGRIFNIQTTYNREISDGDITGELSFYKIPDELAQAKKNLQLEVLELHLKILAFDKQIKSFSVKDYAHGLMMVQQLHQKMEGTI